MRNSKASQIKRIQSNEDLQDKPSSARQISNKENEAGYPLPRSQIKGLFRKDKDSNNILSPKNFHSNKLQRVESVNTNLLTLDSKQSSTCQPPTVQHHSSSEFESKNDHFKDLDGKLFEITSFVNADVELNSSSKEKKYERVLDRAQLVKEGSRKPQNKKASIRTKLLKPISPIIVQKQQKNLKRIQDSTSSLITPVLRQKVLTSKLSQSAVSVRHVNQMSTSPNSRKEKHPTQLYDANNLKSNKLKKSNKPLLVKEQEKSNFYKTTTIEQRPHTQSKVLSPKTRSSQRAQSLPRNITSSTSQQIKNQPAAYQYIYIDEAEPNQPHENLARLSQLQEQLQFCRQKILTEASMIDLDDVIVACRQPVPPSGAYLKALRALCLVMKASTQLSATPHRQIKDNEMFERWDRIQQYINSQQGKLQIEQISTDSLIWQKDFTSKVLRQPLEQLQSTIFKFIPNEEVNLISPRVKNINLKCYFSLAYFLIMSVRISDKITTEQQQNYSTQQSIQSVQSCSTDKHKTLDQVIVQNIHLESRKPKREIEIQQNYTLPTSMTKSVTPKQRNYQRETLSTSIRKLSCTSQHSRKSLSRGSSVASRLTTKQHSQSSNLKPQQSTAKKYTPSKLQNIKPQVEKLYGLMATVVEPISTAKKILSKEVEMFSSNIKMTNQNTVEKTRSLESSAYKVSPHFRRDSQTPQDIPILESSRSESCNLLGQFRSAAQLKSVGLVKVDEVQNEGDQSTENTTQNQQRQLIAQGEALFDFLSDNNYLNQVQTAEMGEGLISISTISIENEVDEIKQGRDLIEQINQLGRVQSQMSSIQKDEDDSGSKAEVSVLHRFESYDQNKDEKMKQLEIQIEEFKKKIIQSYLGNQDKSFISMIQ